MGKPPIKSTKKLIKAELDAKAKFKMSELGIKAELQDLLIGMVNKIDPLELAGIAATTVVVKSTLETTQEFITQAKAYIDSQLKGKLASEAYDDAARYVFSTIPLAGLAYEAGVNLRNWIIANEPKEGGAGTR